MIGCLYRPSTNGEGRFGQLMKPKRSDSHTVAFAPPHPERGEFSHGLRDYAPRIGLDGINRLRVQKSSALLPADFPANCDVHEVRNVRLTCAP